MKYNEIFSRDEWEMLKSAFPLVFYLIAGADQKVDKKEKNAINLILEHPDRIDNNLAFQLLSDIDRHDFDNAPLNITSHFSSLKDISDILDNKLEAGKSIKFKKMLISLGIYIANASGDFFAAKMSDIEAEAINKISDTFSLSIDDLNAKPSVKKILRKQIKKLEVVS